MIVGLPCSPQRVVRRSYEVAADVDAVDSLHRLRGKVVILRAAGNRYVSRLASVDEIGRGRDELEGVDEGEVIWGRVESQEKSGCVDP